MALTGEDKLRIATGREQLRQRLHAHPAPEALVIQVADAGRLGQRGGLRFVVIVDVLGRRFDIVPARGDTRSDRFAREARERVIKVKARGQGWQRVAGAAIASEDLADAELGDAYVFGEWRTAQGFGFDLADLGGMTEYNVQLAVSLGFLDAGEYVHAGFRR